MRSTKRNSPAPIFSTDSAGRATSTNSSSSSSAIKTELYQHLLETEEYREEFYRGDLEKIAEASTFRVRIK